MKKRTVIIVAVICFLAVVCFFFVRKPRLPKDSIEYTEGRLIDNELWNFTDGENVYVFGGAREDEVRGKCLGYLKRKERIEYIYAVVGEEDKLIGVNYSAGCSEWSLYKKYEPEE
ncbi:MAG: hypothetical protein J5717_13710 [Lachnospiraceae bacterium]|nr:hypothetical protein [Lachnospiraceae bacterium]MBR5992324.1 hypothetical protein [Lachnospiraceae bacterium]